MGKPIYITETGIADAKDTLRAEWAESYFRAVRVLCAGVFCFNICAAYAYRLICIDLICVGWKHPDPPVTSCSF